MQKDITSISIQDQIYVATHTGSRFLTVWGIDCGIATIVSIQYISPQPQASIGIWLADVSFHIVATLGLNSKPWQT